MIEGKKYKVSIELDRQLWLELRDEAAKNRVTITEVIRSYICYAHLRKENVTLRATNRARADF